MNTTVEVLLIKPGGPYWRNKDATRKKLVKARVREDNVPMIYLNQVGGQDELVYDGASFAIEPGDTMVLQGKSFETELIVSDWVRTDNGWRCATPRGRERTKAEFAKLLRGAGFRLARVIATRSPLSVVEAVKA